MDMARVWTPKQTSLNVSEGVGRNRWDFGRGRKGGAVSCTGEDKGCQSMERYFRKLYEAGNNMPGYGTVLQQAVRGRT